MAYEPPRPYRGLAKIIAKVCDDLGQPYPWHKPPLHVDLPALPDDSGPVETMLAEAAGHRQFMASVASPPPAARGDRLHWQPLEPDPVLEPEKHKPRTWAEIEREVRAKQSLRKDLPSRDLGGGRSRGMGHD